MSSTDSVHAAPPGTENPAHGACENCAATLHGHYCHHCGQSAHNPLKHVGHAIEEVFESFWHLDGRIFRTLRDLWIPGRIALNYIQRMGGKTDLYMQAILTALPGALFFLMPVFALVLRIAYIPRTMGYLGHLVVALYSHCWLMMVVLATFLVASINHALASPAFATLSLWITALLWLAVPVYLLWMQQRVYGGNKVLTLLRYTLIGGVYFFLVNVVVMYAVLAGISA